MKTQYLIQIIREELHNVINEEVKVDGTEAFTPQRFKSLLMDLETKMNATKDLDKLISTYDSHLQGLNSMRSGQKSTASSTVSLSELRSIVREEILKELEMSPKQGSVTTLQKNLRTIGSKPMSGVSGGEAANAEQLITSILDQIQTSKQDMTTVLKLLTQKLSQLTTQK